MDKDKSLKQLKEELEDVQLEKKMTFDQDGLHIWSRDVGDQFEEYDREIQSFKDAIARKEGKK